MKKTQKFQPESALIKGILLIAPQFNSVLFRNTVGFFTSFDGRPIHSGLCKGSSDLIGWTSIVLNKQPYGVFTAVEVKTERTRTTKEQLNFVKNVNDSGGIAFVCFTVNEYSVLMKQAIHSFKDRHR